MNRGLKKTLLLACAAVSFLAFVLAITPIIRYRREAKKNENIVSVLAKQAVTPVSEISEAASESTQESVADDTLPYREPPEDKHLTPAPIEVDFGTLWETDEQIVAWLYCEDPQLSYPVAKSEDNAYYLDHLVDGSYNPNGTLFLDCRNQGDFSDVNSVIYGHNMKSGQMFGVLPEYRKADYYQGRTVWYLVTPEQAYRVDLVAGLLLPQNDPIYTPSADSDPAALWERVAPFICFSTGETVSETDRLLSLSTCAYDYEGARFLLIGRLTELEPVTS